ncbi:MAG: stress response translation initiation inhibitor YciH [Candidatus Aenigmatarchaeota archaeon]|nr:MAG: stress response translation initiation inhibitor YciH [Candidatus Aenigmarchaeota archaeon]
MPEICPKCGLPKELCTCEVLAKEREKIKVFTVQRRYGKIATVVQGISEDVDVKAILKELKTRLACGGTLRDHTIELQGNHKERIKAILVKLGFPEEQIEIS